MSKIQTPKTPITLKKLVFEFIRTEQPLCGHRTYSKGQADTYKIVVFLVLIVDGGEQLFLGIDQMIRTALERKFVVLEEIHFGVHCLGGGAVDNRT